MARLIKLTPTSDNPDVWVNPDNIAYVARADNGGAVIFFSALTTYSDAVLAPLAVEVQESPEKISQILEGLNGSGRR